MSWRCIAAMVLGSLTACSIGGRVSAWKPSAQAGGTEIELDLGNLHKVRGELITLDSAGFLILEAGRLVRVDPVVVKSGSGYKTSFDSPLSSDNRERLRLMSRYPQGVSAEVEHSLLDAYGFSQVEVEATPARP
jgi:hypothetical protein